MTKAFRKIRLRITRHKLPSHVSFQSHDQVKIKSHIYLMLNSIRFWLRVRGSYQPIMRLINHVIYKKCFISSSAKDIWSHSLTVIWLWLKELRLLGPMAHHYQNKQSYKTQSRNWKFIISNFTQNILA